MKKYGLGFDDESIKESIIKNYTGRNHNLKKFIEFLNSQENYSKIALDGDWGSGKTYFIKQLKYILDLNSNGNNRDKQDFQERNDLKWINNLNANYEIVYFDSWKYESEDIDPIVLLLNVIQKDSIMHKISKEFIDIVERLVELRTGGVIKQEKIKKILTDVDDPIDKFKKALNEYLNNIPNKRLVIIIDELDRCKPTYAINLLERVQHCLDNDKLTFVFSTNLSELSNTVKQIYGASFNGDSYLDRFFDYTLLLLEPNLKNYYDKVISPDNLDLFNIANEVARYFNFTLRQLNHYFSRISLLENKMNKLLKLEIDSGSESHQHYFLIKYFATFMIALKMSNNKDYNEFLEGNKGDSIINFLKKNNTFRVDFYHVFPPAEHINSLKEKEKEQKYANIVKIIYTGLFNNNEAYRNFHYPDIPGIRAFGSIDGGDIDRDKNYLLDIVSLIGEDIEY